MNATDEIIFSMAATYGLPIPSQNLLADYLSKGFITVIEDFGYSELTLAEIILAIQLNSFDKLKNPLGEDLKQVPTPQNICTAFLASILRNYKSLRDNLDRMIESRFTGL